MSDNKDKDRKLGNALRKNLQKRKIFKKKFKSKKENK